MPGMIINEEFERFFTESVEKVELHRCVNCLISMNCSSDLKYELYAEECEDFMPILIM